MRRYPSSPHSVSFSFGPGPVSPAIKALIYTNIGMFVLAWFVEPVTWYLGLRPESVFTQFYLWQPVTYLFLHSGPLHIIFNMLALWMFGVELERLWGTRFFLKYYFVTGIGAGLATLAVNWYSGMGFIPVVGASGAIFGLLLAFATYFPDTRILFMFFIPMRAPVAVLVFAGIELFSMFTGTRSGVAHLTHLAGLAVAWLYFIVRLGINPARVFFRRRW